MVNGVKSNIAEHFNTAIFDMSLMKESLNSMDIIIKLSEGEKNNNELRSSFDIMFKEFDDFTKRFLYFQQTNDAIGLRTISEKAQRFAEIRSELAQHKIDTPISNEA